MKKVLTITVTTLLFVAAAFAAIGDVISSFPSPEAWFALSGLAWDGTYLWGCGEPSVFFYCLTTTGSLVKSFPLTGGSYGFYSSAAFDGEYLWSASWDPQLNKTYCARFTTSGSYAGGFTVPHYTGGWRCLAWENGGLWITNEKYTPSGSLLTSFPKPFQFADMGWDGHYLWAGCEYYTYRISTLGSVTASFPVPGNGIAGGATFDGLYLWQVNKDNKWVYQLDIGVEGADPASFGKIKGLYR